MLEFMCVGVFSGGWLGRFLLYKLSVANRSQKYRHVKAQIIHKFLFTPDPLQNRDSKWNI